MDKSREDGTWFEFKKTKRDIFWTGIPLEAFSSGFKEDKTLEMSIFLTCFRTFYILHILK